MNPNQRNDVLDEFVRNFTTRRISRIQIRKQYFNVSDDLIQLKNKVNREPFSIGLFLGEERNNRFVPSSNLMDWLSENSEKKAFINHKAEWLFLCGRVVLQDSITKMNAKDGLVLVQNENDENLGFGKIFRENNKIVIRNVFDKGSFLRREKQKMFVKKKPTRR